MSYVDEFDHWMVGSKTPDFDAMFDEELGNLRFSAACDLARHRLSAHRHHAHEREEDWLHPRG